MNRIINNTSGRFADTPTLVTAVREAVAQAIERHRRLGESIVVCREGQVVVVPPEEIAPYANPSD